MSRATAFTLLALCNLLWAGNWIVGRALRDAFDPVSLNFWRWLIAVLALAPFALPGWVWPDAITWVWLVGVGVSTQIAQVALTKGLAREAAGRATAVGYLQVAFATLFSRCGIAHVHTAGDGFVCGIPDHPRERDEHLERFLKAYNDFVGEVREMDAEIAADAHQTGRPAPPRLGTRLGATSGDYFFGKIGLAAATASAFDGEHVIAAARLEGALGAYIKEHDKDDNLLHAVLVSTAAQTEFAQLLPTLLTPIKEIPAAAKEFKDATAMLYRVP